MTPAATVVVPTRDRPASLLALLRSLAEQEGASNFEVIVVDDGSRAGLPEEVYGPWPFRLQTLARPPQGEVAARNAGVQAASGEIVLLLDDDIRPVPGYVAAHLAEQRLRPRSVVLGRLFSLVPEPASPFQRWLLAEERRRMVAGEVPFTECYSGILSVRRADFFAIGGMLPLSPAGRNPWGGVDFGYRAHLLGYRFYRAAGAVAEHDDPAARDLQAACARWEAVSASAPALFARYPELESALAMFRDKGPVRLGAEPVALSARKCLRAGLATPPALTVLRCLVRVLEASGPGSALLPAPYRWLIGAYIQRGYRAGRQSQGRSAPFEPEPRPVPGPVDVP